MRGEVGKKTPKKEKDNRLFYDVVWIIFASILQQFGLCRVYMYKELYWNIISTKGIPLQILVPVSTKMQSSLVFCYKKYPLNREIFY